MKSFINPNYEFNIIISMVTYKHKWTDIETLIKKIIAINSFLKIHFVLVDNSPTEELHSRDFSRIITEENPTNKPPSFEFIFNKANLGYGKAHNLAMKKTFEKSPYHLILNPDIDFNPSEIKSLFNYMEKNLNVGLLMPKVLYPNGDFQYLCKPLPSPFQLFIRVLPFFPALKKWSNKNYEMRDLDYSKIISSVTLSGCFMLLRKSILEKIGFFDERYFMYMEDFDLCRRIYAISDCHYFPEVSIIHEHQKGSHKNLKLFRIHLSSAFKYFNKWGWFFDSERKKLNSLMNEKNKNSRK